MRREITGVGLLLRAWRNLDGPRKVEAAGLEPAFRPEDVSIAVLPVAPTLPDAPSRRGHAIKTEFRPHPQEAPPA